MNMYFSMNGDTDINITEKDYVCSSCYNHHLVIAQRADLLSTDVELEQVLSSQSSPAPWAETNTYVTEALQRTIQRLGDVLMKKLAVLFPDFIHLALKESGCSLTEVQVNETVSKKNFFGYITSFFGKHMVCQCYQRTYGVLMYRRGTNLGEVLSKTLRLSPDTSQILLGQTLANQDVVVDEDAKLLSFCDTLNDKIHKQIRYITNKDSQSPYDISNFSLESCISDVDPLLWKTMLLLTRTVSERRKNTVPENVGHQRKLHCLYTLCHAFQH